MVLSSGREGGAGSMTANGDDSGFQGLFGSSEASCQRVGQDQAENSECTVGYWDFMHFWGLILSHTQGTYGLLLICAHGSLLEGQWTI